MYEGSKLHAFMLLYDFYYNGGMHSMQKVLLVEGKHGKSVYEPSDPYQRGRLTPVSVV